MGKYQVSYSRKVCTPNQYENMSIGLQIEDIEENRSPDDAFLECVRKVEGWKEQRLYEMRREVFCDP